MKYNIPLTIKRILENLIINGFEAFVVGGAVRNLYLELDVVDWDINTNALPEDIERIFTKTIPTGKKFGTITVIEDGMNVEITTYRKDIGYSDNRKPDNVIFTDILMEDLLRRDFTMNTMILNVNGELEDPLNGIEAIKSRKLVCVGDIKERFDEDYLRVLRYVRFTAQLEYEKNPEIDEVIKKLPFSRTLSEERIREEFNKILTSRIPSKGVRHLKSLDLLDEIIPEMAKCYNFDQKCTFHHLDVFEHTLVVLDNVPPVLKLRLAALLHDIGKPYTFEMIKGEGHFYSHDKKSAEIADVFMKKLKYSNAIRKDVLALIMNHMRLIDLSNKKSIKKFINKIGVELLDDFLILRRADILGCKNNDDLSSVDEMKKAFDDILSEKEPMKVTDLAVNGYDIMALGYEGKEVGMVLNELLEHVLENPILNNKADLLYIIKNNL